MLIMIRSLMCTTIKGMGALALGGVILWQVAEHSGCEKGMAYVHVSASNVEVMVDDVPYQIESLWETPIVCELCSGRHWVRMSRSGRVLFEEEFTLLPGGEIVLVASERPGETQSRAADP